MHGVAAQALPGLSVFSCVPTEINPPCASIETGLKPAAARPVARLLPYLSLNPPGSPGSPNTGRPAMTSSMYRSTFEITLRLTFSSPSEALLPFPANWAMNSHPGISNLSVCLRILGALRQRPSPMTSITPPLILVRGVLFLFTMFLTSLYPAHS